MVTWSQPSAQAAAINGLHYETPRATVTFVLLFERAYQIASRLAALFLILFIVSCAWKKIPFRAGLMIASLVIYPASVVCASLNNLGAWTRHGAVTNQAGESFAFLDSSFLQGQTMVIAREVERSWLYATYEELASTNGDSPRIYMQIVRPAGSSNGYGQLYLANDNLLLGVRRDNHLYLAYDLQSNTAYYWDDIFELSPFLLMEEGTAIRSSDRRDLYSIGIGRESGQPRYKAVDEALSHPNAEVRDLAARMLQKFRPG